jgi:hypothetical protein
MHHILQKEKNSFFGNYKKYVFNLINNNEKGFIRIRDENGRIIIAIKKISKK